MNLDSKGKYLRRMIRQILVSLLITTVFSCTKKETSPPSAGETNAILLAGPKGGSKTWKIVSISESTNAGTPHSVSVGSGIPNCESDNVFTFTHNAAQNYKQTEGAISCSVGDVSTIESGSWSFSEDGKSLFIETTVYPSSAQFQNESPSSGYFLYYLILFVGKPLTISNISKTSLTVFYSGSYIDNSNNTVNYVDTLVFSSND